jgi:hypothetical protein
VVSSATAAVRGFRVAARRRLGGADVHRLLVGRDEPDEERGVLEVDRAHGVEDQLEDEVAARLDQAGEEREVRGLLARGHPREREQLLGLASVRRSAASAAPRRAGSAAPP